MSSAHKVSPKTHLLSIIFGEFLVLGFVNQLQHSSRTVQVHRIYLSTFFCCEYGHRHYALSGDVEVGAWVVYRLEEPVVVLNLVGDQGSHAIGHVASQAFLDAKALHAFQALVVEVVLV